MHLLEISAIITHPTVSSIQQEYARRTILPGHDSQYKYGMQITMLKFPTELTAHLDS